MHSSHIAILKSVKSLYVGVIIAAMAVSHWPRAAQAQYANDQLVLPPPREVQEVMTLPSGEEVLVPSTPTPLEAVVNADYLARAAIITDDGRLAGFAKGALLPSAIPVAGQPFYGADARTRLHASGSAVRLNTFSPATADFQASAHAQLMVQNAALPTTFDEGNANLSVRQLILRVERLTIGVMDSALSDPSAVPETLDLAGPNARITAYAAGLGDGQGRLSYDFFSAMPDGFKVTASVEQAKPEVRTDSDHEGFTHLPDFVCASQYVAGDYAGNEFYERWHIQVATILRDLSAETPDGFAQSTTGFGGVLSGAYRIALNPNLQTLDRVMFSVAYGEGISHYITDLNAAPDAGDGVITPAGMLEELPVFAWYAAYSHNWTDYLRSTAVYSHVNLDSLPAQGDTASPYHAGDYFAVNLVRHFPLSGDSQKPNDLFTGIEYLYGQKETFDGVSGDAHRVMFLLAISKK